MKVQWIFESPQERPRLVAAEVESVTLFPDGKVEGFVRLLDSDGSPLQSVSFSFTSDAVELVMAINQAVFGALLARGVVPAGELSQG